MSRSRSFLFIVVAFAVLAVVPALFGRYNNYVFSLWLVTAVAAMGRSRWRKRASWVSAPTRRR